MKFYYKGQKVSKKDAKEQIDRVWGKGTFDKRVGEALQYFREEPEDDYCSWMDLEIGR